jgi:hypothetical protein
MRWFKPLRAGKDQNFWRCTPSARKEAHANPAGWAFIDWDDRHGNTPPSDVNRGFPMLSIVDPPSPKPKRRLSEYEKDRLENPRPRGLTRYELDKMLWEQQEAQRHPPPEPEILPRPAGYRPEPVIREASWKTVDRLLKKLKGK